MNNVEALSLLQAQLWPSRERCWSQLRAPVNRSHRVEVTGETGTWYQVEIQVFWDDKPNGTIRVMASVDDGGWRALLPLIDGFIRTPDE